MSMSKHVWRRIREVTKHTTCAKLVVRLMSMSEKLSGKTPKEEMGLDRKWLYYFTRAWAAAIKMGLSLHERAAAIISPTTWYFVPGLPRLSNVVKINPKKQKTTQEKAYLLIRYVLFHCLFYLCILYFRSLLHLDLKCYSLEGGRKMEWTEVLWVILSLFTACSVSADVTADASLSSMWFISLPK